MYAYDAGANRSLYLDGHDGVGQEQVISIPLVNPLATNRLITYWFNPVSDGDSDAGRAIFAARDGGGGAGLIGVLSGTSLIYRIFDTGGGNNPIFSAAIGLGLWQHHAIYWNAATTTATVYINGSPAPDAVLSGTFAPYTGPSAIGNNAVAPYDRELEMGIFQFAYGTDISIPIGTLYNSHVPFDWSSLNLEAFYQMVPRNCNAEVTDGLIDLMGNGNHGTCLGFSNATDFILSVP